MHRCPGSHSRTDAAAPRRFVAALGALAAAPAPAPPSPGQPGRGDERGARLAAEGRSATAELSLARRALSAADLAGAHVTLRHAEDALFGAGTAAGAALSDQAQAAILARAIDLVAGALTAARQGDGAAARRAANAAADLLGGAPG